MKAVYGLLSCIVFVGLRAETREENNTNMFLLDIITTFRLTSPTIVYNEDEEAPDICYSAQWVLCLHSGLTSWYPEYDSKRLAKDSKNSQNNSKKLVNNSTGDFKYITIPGDDDKRDPDMD